MGALDRARKREAARAEGAEAFKKGLALADNPYKRSAWGMGLPWDSGWRAAAEQEAYLAAWPQAGGAFVVPAAGKRNSEEADHGK